MDFIGVLLYGRDDNLLENNGLRSQSLSRLKILVLFGVFGYSINLVNDRTRGWILLFLYVRVIRISYLREKRCVYQFRGLFLGKASGLLIHAFGSKIQVCM